MIPAHVPPELVRDYPLGRRRTIYENPYETIIPELHAGPPAWMAPDAYLSVSPAWVFRRAADIKAIFLDPANFIKKGNTNFAQMIGEEWDVIPTEFDPPRHTAVRRALNPMFTPAKVGAFEHKVRERAQQYIAKFKDRGHCDFAKEFAVPYPVSIFLDLLGLPTGRMEEFLEWEWALIHASDIDDRAAGVRAVKAYLLDAIEERRRHPTDDLISNALNLEVDGKKLSPIEVFGHCFNLYIGGLDTVSANIGLHFMHLATHPEQQQLLRDDPTLINKAMMEMLRAYSATSHQRICAHDVEIAGARIKAGARVLLPIALAGRDPEQYENPDEIRFDRNASNMTFGFGIHRCLGVYLAQREILFALEEMLATVPEFRFEGRLHHPIPRRQRHPGIQPGNRMELNGRDSQPIRGSAFAGLAIQRPRMSRRPSGGIRVKDAVEQQPVIGDAESADQLRLLLGRLRGLHYHQRGEFPRDSEHRADERINIGLKLPVASELLEALDIGARGRRRISASDQHLAKMRPEPGRVARGLDRGFPVRVVMLPGAEGDCLHGPFEAFRRGADQLIASAEVVVYGPARYPGALCDIDERDHLLAAGGHHLARDVGQPPASRRTPAMRELLLRFSAAHAAAPPAFHPMVIGISRFLHIDHKFRTKGRADADEGALAHQSEIHAASASGVTITSAGSGSVP